MLPLQIFPIVSDEIDLSLKASVILGRSENPANRLPRPRHPNRVQCRHGQRPSTQACEIYAPLRLKTQRSQVGISYRARAVLDKAL